MESKEYLSKQILTYLGNKRLLLNDIESVIKEIHNELKVDKTTNLDLFSGSGIVARMMKQYSSLLLVNDLEDYSRVLNECYLSNYNEEEMVIIKDYYDKIIEYSKTSIVNGIISNNYAPSDDNNIGIRDRVFYTKENANIIDTLRNAIDVVVEKEKYRKFFLAPLIIEASIHTNTSGVFKGFYKDKNTGIGIFGGTEQNALKRIKGKIELRLPVLSNYSCDYKVYKEDAVQLAKKIKNIDIVYMDPPYNQHPYGSNYFMLNTILRNKMSDNISEVSGIPFDWNRSVFNRKIKALSSLEEIVKNIDTKYMIISYNSEGFIEYNEMQNMLQKYGDLKVNEINYYVFRGSRNLCNRNTMLKEYLFILKKKKAGD